MNAAVPGHSMTGRRARTRAIAKYDPLYRFLRASGKQNLDVGMDDIADMIADGLPPSAYDRTRRMWWSNTADVRHVQAGRGWLAAGYVVAGVDYAQRRVRFSRRSSYADRDHRPA
jgi:hypothetical protein